MIRGLVYFNPPSNCTTSTAYLSGLVIEFESLLNSGIILYNAINTRFQAVRSNVNCVVYNS